MAKEGKGEVGLYRCPSCGQETTVFVKAVLRCSRCKKPMKRIVKDN